MNLNYRFSLDQPSRREIGDPTVVLYKDNYYLFASKSGGYWHSSDLVNWKLVTTTDIPLENNAPTAFVIGDWLYFFTSLSNTIYRSNDPASGKWEIYNNSFSLSMISDAVIFADTDGKVYCYYGCSNDNRLMARELNVKDKLNPIGLPIVCLRKNPYIQTVRKPGEKSPKTTNPGVLGSWMNKYKGKYYYQCSEPDPDTRINADVVYVSDKPLGPFTYSANNPLCSKSGGFLSGTSHGSTFADKYGNWWHITTTTLQPTPAPRLALFPAGFDNEGNLFTYTAFGDYPFIMPDHKYADVSELNPGWSLLSYNKPAEASSKLSSNPVSNAFDENIATFWSSKFANKDEWLSVDLGSVCTINAVQINFAENKTRNLGRKGIQGHQYLVEYSEDKRNWKTLIDKTNNTDDFTHQFNVIDIPVQARYVKIINYCVPDGTFAISGMRVFGSGTSTQPAKILSFFALKDFKDPGKVKVSWTKKENVTGYNIRYGLQKDKLYHCIQVFSDSPVNIRTLERGKTYWFAVDAFGENGVTPSDAHPSH